MWKYRCKSHLIALVVAFLGELLPVTFLAFPFPAKIAAWAAAKRAKGTRKGEQET